MDYQYQVEIISGKRTFLQQGEDLEKLENCSKFIKGELEQHKELNGEDSENLDESDFILRMEVNVDGFSDREINSAIEYLKRHNYNPPNYHQNVLDNSENVNFFNFFDEKDKILAEKYCDNEIYKLQSCAEYFQIDSLDTFCTAVIASRIYKVKTTTFCGV